MVEKLKSIVKRTPWSLLGKAFLLTLTWSFAPWWAFLLVASYLYFRSGPAALRFFPTFAVLLALSFFAERSYPSGAWEIGFGTVFYVRATLLVIFFTLWLLLLGIKELLFVRRRYAYALLLAVGTLLSAFLFFSSAYPGNFLPFALVFAVPVFVFFAEFFVLMGKAHDRAILYAGIGSLAILQISWALSFFPLGIFGGGLLVSIAAFFFAAMFFGSIRQSGNATLPGV